MYDRCNCPLECPYCGTTVKSVLSTDQQIVAFALNLEYLETDYYKLFSRVKYKNQKVRDLVGEIYGNELAHVDFYKKYLGNSAPDKPNTDIRGGMTAAAHAAGLIDEGEKFDPTESEIHFLLGGMLIEDIGVTAYNGAIPQIQDEGLRGILSGVLAVESHHMGFVRSFLYMSGDKAIEMAAAISKARNKIDGNLGLDQPLVMDDKANFVPSTPEACAFSRTPKQVLKLVTLGSKTPIGGFFPEGLNGEFPTILN